MRGRRPKPTALHKLQGTYNVTDHGRSRSREPIAGGDLNREPPTWLTASQKDAWRYAIDNMPKGVAKKIDLRMLVAWVEAYDRHRTAMMMQARLDADATLKLLIKTPVGLMASPCNDILDKAARKMFRAAQELEFSPAARPRLHAEPERTKDDADNPWAALRLIPGGRAD
jgi:P27 family predicted phage terminase small subunit